MALLDDVQHRWDADFVEDVEGLEDWCCDDVVLEELARDEVDVAPADTKLIDVNFEA